MFQQPIRIFSSLEKSYSPNRPINPVLCGEKSGIWDFSKTTNFTNTALIIDTDLVSFLHFSPAVISKTKSRGISLPADIDPND